MIQNDPLYSKKAVVYPANSGRWIHNSDDATQITDNNIDDRIAKLGAQIDNKYAYRIPLKYFCDIGKINSPTKIDIKIRLTLQSEMKKLFESKKKFTDIGASGVQTVFLKAPFFQYKQLLLKKHFYQYLKTILISSKVLRMGIQKTPYQKTYEVQIGSQELTVYFKGSDRQFDWLEVSMVNYKTDKHLAIHNSYNPECAAQKIKSLQLANISKAYSVTNTVKFDTSNDIQKICSGNNLLAGIAKAIVLRQILIILIIQYFKSFISKKLILMMSLTKEFTSIHEIKRPSRNGSKLTLTIKLKTVFSKKRGLGFGDAQKMYIFIC